jgi:curved DNA-binding protein CbpA
MGGRDFYKILGVARDADEDALKRAYKKQAFKYHPDKHANKSQEERKAAEERFKDVAEALEVLSDKNKRAVYDRYGEEGLKHGAPTSGREGASGDFPGAFGGPGGMPGGVHFSFSSGSGGGGMDAARAQEIFAQFFGNGSLGGLGADMAHDGGDPFASLLGGGGGLGGGLFGGMRPGGMGARTARHGRANSPDRPDRLPRNATVRLVDLSSSQHNGTVGQILDYDEGRSRYHVRLRGSGGETLSVRARNMRQVITDARVVGIQNDGALNGRVASAAMYDAAARRYKCEGLKVDHTVLALKPENVQLPKDCRVTIDGVQSRPALNGRIGNVVGVQGNDRYLVQLPEETLSLRFGAVAAC